MGANKLISKKYFKMNHQLHESKTNYGKSTVKYKDIILNLINKYNFKTMIDYGCGKQSAKSFLPDYIKYIPYDPAFEEINKLPEPEDFLICTDVLEHIEPEFLDNVLKTINEKTKKICFLTIALRSASKILSDGRNAHLIVENRLFWLKKINNNFTNYKIINEEYLENQFLNLTILKE